MASNYLEDLVAQWYDFNGYLVKRNLMVGKRPKGGYACELDVVAFNPLTKHLVHVEPTHDADAWAKRERRYKKKFDAGRKHIPEHFEGIELPERLEQICILGFGSSANHKTLGGGRIITIAEFLEQILRRLAKQNLHREAASESHPLLRTLQFITQDKRRFGRLLLEL